ncbi:MAG: superinfection immunity protein [Alphaproteobacteria bacterium]|nr:superinfection immunity protein [Alphaproteobacteria bacterium]
MIIIAKYIFAILLITAILMAPAYLARQAKKGNVDMFIVRTSSWVLGWTGVGYLFALWWAVKK